MTLIDEYGDTGVVQPDPDPGLVDLRRDNLREAMIQGAQMQAAAILEACGLAPRVVLGQRKGE